MDSRCTPTPPGPPEGSKRDHPAQARHGRTAAAAAVLLLAALSGCASMEGGYYEGSSFAEEVASFEEDFAPPEPPLPIPAPPTVVDPVEDEAEVVPALEESRDRSDRRDEARETSAPGGRDLWDVNGSAEGGSAAPAPDEPAPPPVQSLDPGEELQRAYDALPWGRIAFEPKRTMRQGVEETVVVRISRNEEADLLEGWADSTGRTAGTPGLTGGNPVRVDRIKVSGAMEVELIAADPTAFSIQPPGPQRQAIVGDYTPFSWSVTPLKSGEQVLRLQVIAEIPTSAGIKENRVEVKNADIYVEVNTRYVVGRFWSDNWQWVMGSPLVLGLLGWAARRVTGKLKLPPDADAPPPG